MRAIYKWLIAGAAVLAFNAALIEGCRREEKRTEYVAEKTHREYVAPQERDAREKKYEELARKTKE